MRGRACRDVLELRTPTERLALRGNVRTRILLELGDGPASVVEISTRLGIPRGTVAYHLGVLRKAELVYVSHTRQVRAVTERYYARVATPFVVARSDEESVGSPVLQRFFADYGGSTDITAEDPFVVARIPRDRADDFIARVKELVDEYNRSESALPGRSIGVVAGVYWPDSPGRGLPEPA